MLPLLLGILGITLLIWKEKIAQAMFDIQNRSRKGQTTGTYRRSYSWIVTAAGLLLLIMAVANYFGPILL